MPMNLVRTGSAALVGVGSGVIDGSQPTPPSLNLAGINVNISTLAEGAGLLAGGALQFLMPLTMPNLADGLVDGGIALLARRGSAYAVAALNNRVPGAFYRGGQLGAQVNPALYGGVHRGVAGQTTTLTGLHRARVQ